MRRTLDMIEKATGVRPADGRAPACSPMPIHLSPLPPRALLFAGWNGLRCAVPPCDPVRSIDPDSLSGGHRRYGPISVALEGSRAIWNGCGLIMSPNCRARRRPIPTGRRLSLPSASIRSWLARPQAPRRCAACWKTSKIKKRVWVTDVEAVLAAAGENPEILADTTSGKFLTRQRTEFVQGNGSWSVVNIPNVR